MIIVLLVLVNLTTLVLLNALSDTAHSWRLGQHDIQLARAERVLASAAALAEHTYMNYQPALTRVNFSASFTAVFSYLEQPCSVAEVQSALTDDPPPTQECAVVSIAVTRQNTAKNAPTSSPNNGSSNSTLQAIRVQRSIRLQRDAGFTLPEVMLALLLLTITLPALSQLLGQVGSYWPWVNAAYHEDQRTQNWLAEWQQIPVVRQRTGTFSDGRQWQITPQNGLYYWQVSASAVSAAEQGWYLL